MNDTTIDEKRSQLIEKLRDHVGEITFQYGDDIVKGDAIATVVLALEQDGDGTSRTYEAAICAVPAPRKEAEGIAWQVTDALGNVVTSGVTGRGGGFSFPFDPKIAVNHGQCRLEIGRMSATRWAEKESAAAAAAADEAAHVRRSEGGWSVRFEPCYAIAFDDDADEGDKLPTDSQVGRSKNGRSFLIRVPLANTQNITFPFAAALVEYETEEGQLIASRLIPVGRDEEAGLFVGRLELADFVHEPQSGGYIHCTEVTEQSREVLSRISLAQVEALLNIPYVKYDPERCSGVERLQSILQGAKE
jgi:hypothetical protein